jgi:inhibitor of cysteine peptidase
MIHLTKYEYLILGLILFACLGIAWGVTALSKEYLGGGTSGPLQVSGPAPPAYHAYSQLDNGTTVHIHSRDVITLRLPENPTTGYRWNITTDPGLLTLDDTYIYADPAARMTGEGGVRFLTLEPETTGTEHISAVYKREWEDDSGDNPVFSMTFVVM